LALYNYFAPELRKLNNLEQDGLVTVQPECIEVTTKGRLLVRIACMVFDRHLREGRPQASYSKVM
jgi:oxygen-independent coproporphyrinogen-3 oxidase